MKIKPTALLTLAMLLTLLCTGLAPGAALAQAVPMAGDLATTKLTMKSVIQVDLSKDIATVPLHKGTYKGTTVWYVLMDVSDEGLANSLGLNFAPRLANSDKGCPPCVQAVKSADPVLGRANVDFSGTVDFSPTRILTPGPTGFPPLMAQPGSIASLGYSDMVRVEGSSVVYNAPIIASGDGPFDLIKHTNTHDRVISMDTTKMTVDLQFISAFSHGKDIFYFTFSSSGALSSVLERATFIPALGTLPFGNDDLNPAGARCSIFTIVNGKRGPTSPPAQGLMHVILDNPSGDLSTENIPLLESLGRGGDAHNVLGCFPTLANKAQRDLYTPMWDLNIAVWKDEVVARGQNDAQKDANQIRQLAAQGLITNPGGGMLGSSNFVVNCPALGFRNDAPQADQAPRPQVPAPVPAPGPDQSPAKPPLPNTGPVGSPLLFPQTGFSLNDTFRDFWLANGDLPVFGYPIDSERPVNGRIIQWLERNRFEWHPENNQPYKVQLGRLGVEALSRQGIDWTSLPSVKAASAGCRYFPETQHSLCGDFMAYWQQYGLEFDGLPGKSFNESLALFGLPISEPRMETNSSGNTVLTQWFERARLEFYPNNAPQYRVLVGRLGAELLPNRIIPTSER